MFKRILALLFVAIIMFTCSSCKKNKQTNPSSNTNTESANGSTSTNASVPSENSQVESQTSSIVSADNSQISNVSSLYSTTSEETDNIDLDPEVFEDDTQNGATVEAEKVVAKSGKANGIDVSKWQGKVNWQKVKAAGFDYAYIRIGYRGENGTIYKDEFADYNIQQADKAGLLIGVYFFSTAVTTAEAKEEANWTINAVERYPISYPIVYDCEGFRLSTSRMYNLTATERTDNAIAFLNVIKNNGYDTMFYASRNDLTLRFETQRIEPITKIWVAHYSSTAYPQVETPEYSGKYDMWQYTNMGITGGVSGNVDLNVSYFTVSKASPKSQKAPEIAKEPEIKDSVYTTVSETVTAKDVVNLRESASTKSNILGSLKNGDTLTRVAVGTNGWSKLEFQGKTVFAISSYLTTDLTVKPSEPEVDNTYTAVNETVTAKELVNLRDGASTSANIVGSLKNGDTLTRTGVGTNGWSKLEFSGQTVFAISSYLTTDLSYAPPIESTVSQEVAQSDGFTDVSEQVTAKSETNLRSVPSTKDGAETVVYTLKNGEYIERIGINSASGWSKLIHNGQTVYAISSYLQVAENE